MPILNIWSEKVTLKQRPEGGEGRAFHLKHSGKSIAGQGDSKCKGPWRKPACMFEELQEASVAGVVGINKDRRY